MEVKYFLLGLITFVKRVIYIFSSCQRAGIIVGYFSKFETTL